MRQRPLSALPRIPSRELSGLLPKPCSASSTGRKEEGANTPLKLVCKLTREDVRNAFWSVALDELADNNSQRVVNLKKLRNAYPNALSAVLSRTVPSPARTFAHLRGVRYLHLNGNRPITDAAFGHFQTVRGEKGTD